MHILGISAFYHDSAACLLRDGRIVAAAQEERFTRVKHDPSFPRRAALWCLQSAGIDASALDRVVFYEKPWVKLDRALETFSSVAPRGLRAFVRSAPAWTGQKLRLADLLARHLSWHGTPDFAWHHQSHAASAFFPSPFREAAILTLDGVGEWTTNAVGAGRGNRLELLQEQRFPHSLGLLYSAFTEFLGFEVNEGEYKVMGLAPYGEPRHAARILDRLLDLHPDGSYALDLRFFDFPAGRRTVNGRFADLFGVPPRRPEAPLQAVHMDLARSVQAVTEEVVLRQARHARRLTGMDALCLAGGVALNCVANGRVLREGPFRDLWIQPAAGDAGGALGAALLAWHHAEGRPREPGAPDGMAGARLGPGVDPDEAAEALRDAGLPAARMEDGALHDAVAGLLAEGKVVGWCRGPMEFGPRALGGRSILADPRPADMQRRVNEKIKFREGFRPFAPAVPREDAAGWFDLAVDSPYMLLVAPVAEGRRVAPSPGTPEPEGLARLGVPRSQIPAVTHVDGSARVQTVDGRTDPDFHRLLRAFQARTGCPVLLNTSFNLRGEPIVLSPADACRTFLASGMDALVAGPFLALRPPDRAPEPLARPRPARDPLPSPRRFGLELAAGLAVLAVLLGWPAGRPVAGGVAAGLAAALAALAAARPGALGPVLGPWMAAVRALSGTLGALLLAALYLGVLTPIGVLRRCLGSDALRGTAADPGGSRWRPCPGAGAGPGDFGRPY